MAQSTARASSSSIAPPVIFLNAAVLLDDGQPTRITGAGQALDLGASAAGQSLSAAAINRLARDTGGSVVISDPWGQRDVREHLRARGVTAPFHADYLVDTKPLATVGLHGPWIVEGGDGKHAEAPAVAISMRPTEQPSPIERWLGAHGKPRCIIIDRPTPKGAPGAILVSVAHGSYLSGPAVERILSILASR